MPHGRRILACSGENDGGKLRDRLRRSWPAVGDEDLPIVAQPPVQISATLDVRRQLGGGMAERTVYLNGPLLVPSRV